MPTRWGSVRSTVLGFALVAALARGLSAAVPFTVPLPATVEAGQTLYIRFELLNGQKPFASFNTLQFTLYFDTLYRDYLYQGQFRDDITGAIVASTGVGGPPPRFDSQGIGASAFDPTRGGSQTGGLHGDLSSFADGDGLISASWVSGVPAVFSSLDVTYWRYVGSSGSGQKYPMRIRYAIDAVPPAFPEPSAALSFIALLSISLRRLHR